MAEPNERPEDAEETPRFNQEQYEMLMRCSERKDMTEWNDWRKANPREGVLLDGVDLQGAHLEGAHLSRARLEKAFLPEIHLEGAQLDRAHLETALLAGAHLREASLSSAYLEGASLSSAGLKGADLYAAHLEGTVFWQTNLEGANFGHSSVDGRTVITDCRVDLDTDFTGVGLGSVRIGPGLRQLLEYNVRRKGWEQWYGKGSWWQWSLKNVLGRAFWWMSDYGRSTGRIAATFFGLATLFAVVYWLYPGCLEGNPESKLPAVQGPVHALYFSVVTMTTLGFGDIHAAPDSPGGQILLMVQVLLGYILLAALVTRLAILFTTGGPADTHAPTVGAGTPNGDNESNGKSNADISSSDE